MGTEGVQTVYTHGIETGCRLCNYGDFSPLLLPE